ncbi:hypothetical protein M595_3707 [Lyngbya aestuarii BL J]|uniref:UDP-N-acetyl-alpha-D-muramoyl-L-alanyl-L-glutamate epimerase n=1 Tax=Lyngbya aestuarii BL J TaxID=1348334 RepID=U7QGV4_9CYAN|nr:hypothetical protein [Lyngbya aestuarii]ERT06310.1 hypothetical protein M595_3707 [Lyngbya aestuarii BL J]
MQIETVKILTVKIQDHHLEILYGIDEFQFSTKIFYHDVSLDFLIQRYSAETIHRFVAYIALFEGMKFCSLYPKKFDISVIAEWLSPQTPKLFNQIYRGVFAQNLYENQMTNYSGAVLVYNQDLTEKKPLKIRGENPTVLAGCGGGKDSFLAMKLLEDSNLTFASMQYSHSVYGKADLQHKLIDNVLQHVQPINAHKISIFDDFVDYPFVQLYCPHLSGITVPETPVSIFESLILMLNFDYQYLSLAHEKSANTGNLFSAELGQEVNHQWGKGYEAERIINQFIRDNLLDNFTYFSILQPLYDYRIFKNLSRYPEVLPSLHSCNIQKPWCKKCPKCAYVWLGLMANFEPNVVDAVFQNNLFDDPDLLPIFRQMLGLAEHTPFECIGEINESRLAMKKCLEKGLSGLAMDVFVREVLSDLTIDWQTLEDKYNRVYESEHAIPDNIFQGIVNQL